MNFIGIYYGGHLLRHYVVLSYCLEINKYLFTYTYKDK